MFGEGTCLEPGLFESEPTELAVGPNGLGGADAVGQVTCGGSVDEGAAAVRQQQADLLGGQRRCLARLALGATRRVPDHSGAALVLRVDDRPAVGAASSMSDGST